MNDGAGDVSASAASEPLPKVAAEAAQSSALAMVDGSAKVDPSGGAEAGHASRSRESDKILAAADATFRAKISTPVKVILAVAVIVAFFASFMLGKYSMNPIEVIQTVFGHLFENPQAIDTAPERILFNIRGPRIIIVMLVGAALAVAGASYQGMFKNPLTSPDLLGASAGASLGACLAMLCNASGTVIQFAAFFGALIAVGCAVWLNRLVDYDPTLGLVLAGILVGSLFQAGMSIVKFLADANDKLPEITFWLMGSFAQVDNDDLELVIWPMLIGFVLLLTQAWKLNVLSFGDEEARAMGVNTKRTRLIVILASTLLSASSVAVAGIIGWIGLVVPHLSRAVVGPNYKVLLPTSMFIGAVFLLIVDNVARLALSVEIPIGILTAILGVPFFVFIFKHNMKGWR